jgi:hypothetical protein
MSGVIYTDHGSPQAIGLNFLLAGDGASLWSVYLLHPPSLEPVGPFGGRPELQLEPLGLCLDADFSLLRFTRPWSIDDYSIGLEAVSDIRTANREALRRHVRARRSAVQALEAHTVDVYLAVRLPDRSDREGAGRSPWLIDTERAVFAGVLDRVPARRTHRDELSRLVRASSARATRSQHRVCLRVTASRLDYGVGGFFAQLAAIEFAVDAAITARLDRDRPPRWATNLSLSVSGANSDELDRRMERVRSQLQGLQLHTPESSDPDLVSRHLRPPGIGLRGEQEGLSVARLGSLSLDIAALGSRAGAYIGRTISGARRPVLFDAFESARNGSSPVTLIAGSAGAGKTVCMQLLMHNAFIAGAAVIDIDLGGAHRLELLPDMGERIDVLELSAVKRFRGLLDPLRICAAGDREQLACEFLLGVLPPPIPPGWRTEIANAVSAVVCRAGATCADAVTELRSGTAASRAAARAIEENVTRGLPILGYGRPDPLPLVQEPRQVTSLRLRDPSLTGLPSVGARERRIGHLIVRLVGAYALHLAGMHRNRTCVVGLDDAAALLTDVGGRALIDEFVARGRSGRFAALVVSRANRDTAWLLRRSGAALCFGADAQDAGPGRCMMRDPAGRVGLVQIELADMTLREALGTTPGADPPIRSGDHPDR